MLIAVQQNNKINAVMVDNRQACEMIARAIGRVLDGEQFNILSEVINPIDKVFMSFNDITTSEFIDARHRKHVTRDPLYRFDDLITYEAYDYVLFDLDQDKIIVPDYYDYENETFLHAWKELNSNYEAYKHVADNLNQNTPVIYALDKNLILVKPTNQHLKINDWLVKSTFVFRENTPNSKVMELDYCYCCGTFECKCSEEVIKEFSAGLPF